MPTAMITGANAGLGFEISRQLAEHGYTVILACRNEKKARAAVDRLVAVTGRPPKTFQIVPIDVSVPSSVRDAAHQVAPQQLDVLVLNAGGPMQLTVGAHGVSATIATNAAGHVNLVDQLAADGKFGDDALVLYATSEAVRGAWLFGVPKAVLQFDTDEQVQRILRSEDVRGDAILGYSHAKAAGMLALNALSRRHAGLTVVHVSPGATAGTEVARKGNRESGMPMYMRTMLTSMSGFMLLLGFMHPLSTGARRFTDVVAHPQDYEANGFYASAWRAATTGAVAEQRALVPGMGDPAVEDRMLRQMQAAFL